MFISLYIPFLNTNKKLHLMNLQTFNEHDEYSNNTTNIQFQYNFNNFRKLFNKIRQ